MKKITALILVTTTLALVSTRAAEGTKALYEKQCAKCHGVDGKGDTKMGKKLKAKDYTDPKVQAELKDEKAFKSVREGLKEDDKTLMRPEEKLTDKEIKALVAHMRTFKK